MQRALELAGLGLGKVSPNPLVGCVITHKDKIIGEGWHREFGGPHAEVNAINSVKSTELLVDSTLYVNLEPCVHHGKTPPCTDLIIATGIKKVVISNRDPNPVVAGRGVQHLRDAGIEVITEVMPAVGEYLNRRFFTFHRHQRPYLILKWAETADGFIARENHDSKWISNQCSRQLVHQYRAQEDAIMVGKHTAHYDNPKLTVRHWTGRHPVRIVLDPKLTLNHHLNLFNGTVSTLCYNQIKTKTNGNVEFIRMPAQDFIDLILKDLYQRNILSVLVEGGGILLSSLIKSGNWDEARVFTSEKEFINGIRAPEIPVGFDNEQTIDGDILRTYYNASN